MSTPIRATVAGLVFPDPRDVIADDANRFRRLSAADRWREIFALRSWGTKVAETTSRGEAIRKLEADEESRWQEIQRELFARHAR